MIAWHTYSYLTKQITFYCFNDKILRISPISSFLSLAEESGKHILSVKENRYQCANQQEVIFTKIQLVIMTFYHMAGLFFYTTISSKYDRSLYNHNDELHLLNITSCQFAHRYAFSYTENTWFGDTSANDKTWQK